MVYIGWIQDIMIFIALSCTTTTVCQEYTCSIGPKTTVYDHLYVRTDNTIPIADYTLLLNLKSPSTCNTSVDTWSVCYSSESDNSENIFVGIWRLNLNGSYELVNDSLSPFLVYRFDFACQKSVVSPFEVVEGDVVGVVVNSTMIKIVDEDVDGEVCMTTIIDDEDYQTLNESALGNCFQGYRLSVTGFASNDLFTSPSTTAEPSTTASYIPGTQPERSILPLWVIVVICALALLSVVSICIIVVLSVRLGRQRTGKLNISHSNELRHREAASFTARPREGTMTGENQDITIPTQQKLELTEPHRKDHLENLAESINTLQLRAQTFSFPPPQSKAPSPPQEVKPPISDGWQKSSSNPDIPMAEELQDGDQLSTNIYGNEASSLPDLLSPEPLLYENPVKSLPSTAIDFLPKHTLPDSFPDDIPKKPSSLPLSLEGNAFAESVMEDEEREEVLKSKPKRKETPYTNVKTRAGRLFSDPSGSKLSYVYAEPIPSNQRKQFYTGGKSRIPPIGHKVGAAGKLPVKLPVATRKQRSLNKNNSSNPSVIKSSFTNGLQDDSTLLGKIVELEESGRSSAPREGDETITNEPPTVHRIFKKPQTYLEPVQLKPKSF